MSWHPGRLSDAEGLAALLVALPAALILTAYAVDAAGWPIDPTAMLVLLLFEAAFAVLWAWRGRHLPRLCVDGWGLAGFLVVVGGLTGYILWLAKPSLLPISESGDMVHHLSLIEFIQQRHSLVHDLSLQAYLGEMVSYSPGSHILAAMATSWLQTPALRVLHPLLSVVVALKAGLVYNVILRLLPPARRNPASAIAGAALLLVADGYFLQSFTAWYFYPQVVSELFAIAMLWAVVAWDDQPAPGHLAFFALCGIAVWLTWPVWLPVPLATLVVVLLLQRTAPLGDRVRWLALGVGPIFIVGAAYSVGRLESVGGMLRAEGSVLQPSVAVFGRPFLLLVLLGLAINLRYRRALPVLLFAGATLAQTGVLFAFQSYHQVASYYLSFKMLYLLLYPMAIVAALALATLWHLPERLWPSAWSRRWPALATVLPLAVLALAFRHELPLEMSSPITEPVYASGLWARAHLPTGCTDYLVDHWVTAYWLHINVLGNPRGTPRTEGILDNVSAFRASWASWTSRAGPPYAIIGDLSSTPPKILADVKVLYESSPSAVVQRQGASNCADEVPFDRRGVAPRGWTLASLFGS